LHRSRCNGNTLVLIKLHGNWRMPWNMHTLFCSFLYIEFLCKIEQWGNYSFKRDGIFGPLFILGWKYNYYHEQNFRKTRYVIIERQCTFDKLCNVNNWLLMEQGVVELLLNGLPSKFMISWDEWWKREAITTWNDPTRKYPVNLKKFIPWTILNPEDLITS